MTKFKLVTFIVLVTFSIQASAFAFLLPFLFGAAETGTVAGAGAVTAAEFLAVTGTRVAMKTAIESSLALHGGIAAITFGSAAVLSSQTASSPAPFQIILDPNKPLITPPNWSTPVNPPILSSLSQRYSTTTDSNANVPNFLTSTEVFNDFLSKNSVYQISDNYPNEQIIDPSTSVFYVKQAGSIGTPYGNTPVYVYKIDVCPTGYSKSGSSCNLVQPDLVPKPADNVCQFTSESGLFRPDPRDPDCKNSELFSNGISQPAANQVKIVNPSKTDVNIVTNNSIHNVEIEHIYSDTNGNTVHEKVQIDPSPATPDSPSITGTSKTINTGTGTLEKITTTTNNTTTPATFDKSGLATDTGQNETNSKLQGIKDALNCIDCVNSNDTSSLDKTRADNEIKKSTDLISEQVTSSQNASDESMFGWYFSSPFPTSAACTPFTKTIHGHVITIDTCPYISMIKAFLTWALALYGAYDLLMLIFRKSEVS